MWKVIKNVLNIKPSTNITPDFVYSRSTDGSTKKLTKTIDIANEMNSQFASMGSKLADKLPPSNHIFHEYLEYPNPNKTRMALSPITESEVSTLIQELDASKSVGVDEIPPKIIKWSSSVLTPILTSLFNKCMVAGIYPDSLKIARVKPVYKGGHKDKNDASSYPLFRF